MAYEMWTNGRTHHFSDGITRVAKRLVAHRHTMQPKLWCLSWDFGDGTAVGAEGECSRRMFKTARHARFYGEQHYSERAAIIGSF